MPHSKTGLEIHKKTHLKLQKPEQILIVDDDVDARLIVEEALKQEGYEVRSVESGKHALELIPNWTPGVVLLDINMPGLDGHATLQKIRKFSSYISTIFVSGKSDTLDVIHGLDLGADDYICKPFNVMELLARVRSQLRIKNLTVELAAANAKLKEMVVTDDLTGLYNMRSLYDRLDKSLAGAFRQSRSMAIVMMDMDRFKSVNDTNDHLFGSFVLSEVGNIIRETVRKSDYAARYGGDEFLIALTDVSLSGAQTFCELLRKRIEAYTFEKDSSKMNLTCSLGFAITAPDKEIDARSLVKKADHALYKAKELGRNQYYYYDLSQPKADDYDYQEPAS